MASITQNSKPWPKSVIAENVSEFIGRIASLDRLPRFNYAFRGHGRREWPFVPGIFRQHEALWTSERDIYLTSICRAPSEFSNDRTTYDHMLRLQHFGLPTRLLDVTTNPLVALYFTVSDEENDSYEGEVKLLQVPEERGKTFQSDTVALVSNLTQLSFEEQTKIFANTTLSISEFNKLQEVKKLVEFVQLEKPYFVPRVNPVDLCAKWFVASKRGNSRVAAQQGDMIIFGGYGEKSSGELTSVGTSHPINVVRIRVPASRKREIRDELALLGFSEETMFPGLESAAKEIKKTFRKTPLIQ